MKRIIVVSIFAAVHSMLNAANAQSILVPQQAPYTNDANTILLEHFDGTTGGSQNGSVSFTNGIFGQGVHLTVSSYISWAMGAVPNGTVEFWGKLDNLTNCPTCGSLPVPNFVWSYISPGEIGKGPGSPLVVTVTADDNPGYWHRGMPSASVHNGFSWLDTPTNSVVIQADTWHHYAFTWGLKGLSFYVDGSLLGTGSVGNQNVDTTVWLVSNANGLGFNGVMDELRISNIQREFSAVPTPGVNIEKAVRLDFSNLLIGTTYQLQSSPDLKVWSNFGSQFMATAVTSSQYLDAGDWSGFWRLQAVP